MAADNWGTNRIRLYSGPCTKDTQKYDQGRPGVAELQGVIGLAQCLSGPCSLVHQRRCRLLIGPFCVSRKAPPNPSKALCALWDPAVGSLGQWPSLIFAHPAPPICIRVRLGLQSDGPMRKKSSFSWGFYSSRLGEAGEQAEARVARSGRIHDALDLLDFVMDVLMLDWMLRTIMHWDPQQLLTFYTDSRREGLEARAAPHLEL